MYICRHADYFKALLIIILEHYVYSAAISNIYKPRMVGSLPSVMSLIVSESVTPAVILASEHCQKVFKWDKWNCPREDFERFIYSSGTKEAAFAKAILAAAIVHSITKNCTREIRGCGCNSNYNGPLPNHSNKWPWNKCSDDVSFGNRVAKELFEKQEKSNSVEGFIGKHNFRVGRQMAHQMNKNCRCHGVSGSCSLKNCWTHVKPFEEIAANLKEKYNKAKRLTVKNVESYVALTNNIKREGREKHSPAPDHMLVYVEQSPDYCVANITAGWPGTKGRACSKRLSNFTTKAERKSCRNLCRQCGYKARKQKRVIQRKKNCKFHWCCNVTCDTYNDTIEEFYCA
ncbi:protein Wnt-8a-like isoform X2 [Rhynchophorus ferrugineus]|uniref:protein Wnt-8a-like isoform X2 n=2 Tax=Rhynchophorus ferrugineus TaxID=354439 RepID=UPI003FCE2933